MAATYSRRSISVSEMGCLQSHAKTGDTPPNMDEILKAFSNCSAAAPINQNADIYSAMETGAAKQI